MRRFFKALLKLIHSTSRVNYLVLAGVKRVTVGTDSCVNALKG